MSPSLPPPPSPRADIVRARRTGGWGVRGLQQPIPAVRVAAATTFVAVLQTTATAARRMRTARVKRTLQIALEMTRGTGQTAVGRVSLTAINARLTPSRSARSRPLVAIVRRTRACATIPSSGLSHPGIGVGASRTRPLRLGANCEPCIPHLWTSGGLARHKLRVKRQRLLRRDRSNSKKGDSRPLRVCSVGYRGS